MIEVGTLRQRCQIGCIDAVGGAKRQAAVLKRLAAKAGWGAALPKGTGLGLATTFGQDRDMPTWTACAARVRVDATSGAVKVEKLTWREDVRSLKAFEHE